MAEIELLSVVALLEEIPEKQMRRGQVGTVVEAALEPVDDELPDHREDPSHKGAADNSDHSAGAFHADIHIEINPDVMQGKPVIRGMRVPVELLLRKLAEGAPLGWLRCTSGESVPTAFRGQRGD